MKRWALRDIDVMLAGMQSDVAEATDEQIAGCFGIKREQVRAWRRRHGLRRPLGRPRSRPLDVAPAASRPQRARRHRTCDVEGPVKVPRHVEREDLHYLLLGELAVMLLDAGRTVEDIARGFGILDVDVCVAAEVRRDLVAAGKQ